jgi:hypothetical protein
MNVHTSITPKTAETATPSHPSLLATSTLPNFNAAQSPAAIAVGVDPIFAAIAQYNAAVADHERAVEAMARLIPIPEHLNAATDQAWKVSQFHLGNLIETVPTTMPGVMALLAFVREELDRDLESLEAPHIAYIAEAVETALKALNVRNNGALARANTLTPAAVPTADRLDIRSLIAAHKAAVLAAAAGGDPGHDVEGYYEREVQLWDLVKAANPTHFAEAAMQLVYIAEFADGRAGELGAFVTAKDIAKFAAQLTLLSAPPEPTKQIGALARGNKLTRRGLLHRYHAFLIEELNTVSWDLYGNRDFGTYYQPFDHAVNKRCKSKARRGRSDPFFDQRQLPSRARSVMKSLKIDTERNDDVPARK